MAAVAKPAALTCAEFHDLARRSAVAWSELKPIGVQPDPESSLYDLELANCRTCNSTISRFVYRGVHHEQLRAALNEAESAIQALQRAFPTSPRFTDDEIAEAEAADARDNHNHALTNGYDAERGEH